MKQTWTKEELEDLEDLEGRECYLDAMRGVAYIKKPFRKLRYFCECTGALLRYLFWDAIFKKEWRHAKPTEEFEQAKKMKFENVEWLCSSERWLWEYIFRIEWFLDLWTPEKVDIELAALNQDIEFFNEIEVEDNIARFLDIDFEESIKAAEEIIDAVPVVFLENVGIRRAQYIKKEMESNGLAKINLIWKEENTEE